LALDENVHSLAKHVLRQRLTPGASRLVIGTHLRVGEHKAAHPSGVLS
jgi:hypothetical protein